MIWRWCAWESDAMREVKRVAFLDECSALYEETRPETARVKLLETHLRRVLEAGKHLRVCLDVVNFATYRLEATCRLEIANFDQAASDAEGVLSP